MSIERVSRWFAMGFRAGEDGKDESALPLSSCPDEWQAAELRAGYATALRKSEIGNLKPEKEGGAHIQFWMVSGDWKHADVEREILTTEYTENTEGMNVEHSVKESRREDG